MASEMTVSKHLCEGLLRLILPQDTVTVDMEVMTLKGIYIFRQDKHSNEKTFIPWCEDCKPPSSFLMRLKETQGKPSRDFLQSVVDQNVEPNFRSRHNCTCPKVARLSDIQVIQDVQARHLEQIDNASIHDSQDRPPKPSRRLSYHLDWSDLDDDKDSQALAPPTNAPKQDPQPTTSHTRTDAPLRRPNTQSKVLTFGRVNMAPLVNWFTMGCRHRCRCRLNINHPPQLGAPNVAAVSPDKIIPTDRVQTYDEMPASVRP